VFAKRQKIRQGLTRMLIVRERIDDVQPWRSQRKLFELAMRVRADDDGCNPASRLSAMSPTASRLPKADIRLESDDVAAKSSRTAISNVVHVRRDAFSNNIATCLPESASAVGASPTERAVGFQLRRQIEAAIEVCRLEIEDRQEILPHPRCG
jgi:hypothetical protein